VLPSLIALMMEAAHTSETSVDIQLRTQHYIRENSELQKKAAGDDDENDLELAGSGND
jgi:hypothetical protein